MSSPVELFGDRDRVPESDVTLSFGDGQLYAHRLILSRFTLLKTYFEIAGATSVVDFAAVCPMDVTRETVAGLLAFAYTEDLVPGVLEARKVMIGPSGSLGPDVEPAMAYLDASPTLLKSVRAYGRCKCCDRTRPLAIDEICKQCFVTCGDRETATEQAMWMIGFEPVADAKVDEMCAVIRKASNKTCHVFRTLVDDHLGITHEYWFNSKKRLSDAQARTVKVALDPDWCSLVHIGLHNICAIPGNYEFGPFIGATNKDSYGQWKQSARMALMRSTARMPCCSGPLRAESRDRNAVDQNTCAGRIEQQQAARKRTFEQESAESPKAESSKS